MVCVAGGSVAAVQGCVDSGSGGHSHALLASLTSARQVLQELPYTVVLLPIYIVAS